MYIAIYPSSFLPAFRLEMLASLLSQVKSCFLFTECLLCYGIHYVCIAYGNLINAYKFSYLADKLSICRIYLYVNLYITLILFMYFQIGRNPSAVGSTLLKQGDIHLLRPGNVFSFLQGKHSFIVQFVDTSNSPLKEGTFKKNPSSKGIKNTFQTLKRSISKEILINVVKCSPVKSSIPIDSATTEKMFADEPTNVLQGMEGTDPCSSQGRNLKDEHKSPVQDLTMSSTDKKRKIDEILKNKNAADLPSKLRKSFSGKLVPCISGEDEEKIDLEGLREEFGDAIMQEIEKGQKLPKISSTSQSSNEAECSSTPKDTYHIDQLSKTKENTWISKHDLLVFSGKNLECKEKV